MKKYFLLLTITLIFGTTEYSYAGNLLIQKSDTTKKPIDHGKSVIPDSTSMRWENGKYIGPSKADLFKKIDRENLAKDPKALLGNTSFDTLSSTQDKLQEKIVYSDKRIKQLYDSIGIGKLDSLLAFSKLKKEVNEQDLLSMINQSSLTEGSNLEGMDISKFRMPSESLQGLGPLSGYKLKPVLVKVVDSVVNRYENKLSEKDSIKHLRLLREIDSLKNVYDQSPHTAQDFLVQQKQKVIDSVGQFDYRSTINRIDAKRDSLVQALLNQKKLSLDSISLLANTMRSDTLSSYREKYFKADSIANVLAKKKDFIIKENGAITDLAIDKKNTLMSRFYGEGIFSFEPTKIDNELRISPAIGFRVVNNLSLGVGPNLVLYKQGGGLKMDVGYRSFLKYEVLNQKGYVQLEDWVDGKRIDSEIRKLTNHSVLAGLGGLIPLTKSISINLAVLYRVNNQQYSMGKITPWVFRIGVSFVGDKNNKK